MEFLKFIKQLFHFRPELVIIWVVTIIQIIPIKINPWTALAKWLKKIIIGDVEDKLDSIVSQVNDMDSTSGSERIYLNYSFPVV